MHKVKKYIAEDLKFSNQTIQEMKINSKNFYNNIKDRRSIREFSKEKIDINIIKNAIDSMSGEGTIQIKTIKENSHAKILISDSGSGISNNLKNKIFEEGFTTKEKGWGLGLSFSKRIMTIYHKGDIRVKNSKVGQAGTTFELKIPIN